MTTPASDQAALLAEALRVAAVALHDVGGESRTFRVDDSGRLVTVGLDWPAAARDRADLENEADLLRRVALRVTAPVPEVVSVDPTAGLLVVRELPGRRLIDVPERDAALTATAAEVMARTLAELHTWPLEETPAGAPVDRTTPSEWRDEAAVHADAVAEVLSAQQRADLDAFLARPAPEPTKVHLFTHDDLGIEHVLVDAERRRVTGLIDWSDAAVTDPAVDVARLLRDLGPAALDHALETYRRRGGRPELVMPRVHFYAACGLLEDLVHGLEHERPEYVGKSLAAWDPVLRSR